MRQKYHRSGPYGQDELSTEKQNNAADTGIPVTNDQVKLPFFPPLLADSGHLSNLFGQAALKGLGLPPAHPPGG